MSELQSAVCKMSATDTPLVRAAVVEAPLTEWALKTETSMPASFNKSLIQWAILCEVTGAKLQCGLFILTQTLNYTQSSVC